VVVPNGADALSRFPSPHHHQAHNYRFAYLHQFNPLSRVPTMDAAADPKGENANAPLWLDASHPIETHWYNLIGHYVWANPPWHSISTFFQCLIHCISLQPFDTQALLLVPDHPLQPWYHTYVSTQHPLVKIMKSFPQRRRIFQRYNPVTSSWRNAGPCPRPYPLLLLSI